MAKEEQVLVVERKIIEDEGIFHGLNLDIERYISKIFAPGALKFMPRSEAENDPTYKQLIPYVLLSYEGKLLNYVRGKRAGEKRLVGNRSIGIGGHINPVDDEVPLFGLHKMYLSAVEREIEEEVEIKTSHTETIIGLLNDDSNEVGQVHLGVVHLWELDSPDVNKREQMITQIGFMTPGELDEVRDSLETWSSLCLDGLNEMKTSGKAGISPEKLFNNALEGW